MFIGTSMFDNSNILKNSSFELLAEGFERQKVVNTKKPPIRRLLKWYMLINFLHFYFQFHCGYFED